MYEKLYEQTIDPNQIPFELPEWIACAPFEEYLGMTIEAAEAGRAVLTMPFKIKLAQGAGVMHGGAVTSLADTAVAMAIKSLVPEGTDFVTVEMTLKFLAAVHEGTVRAEARATRLDERKITGAADIFSGTEKVAEFSAFFLIRKKR
ncbi:PaaI family thioesterase [Geomesophilobacter sediminis]|uniref:PaaI family thioesterase n=1 Tax=Geomesophilobacter sediminis TaxID=2798584 RepID=A0A8J7LXJ9_9BACT|nr:PaaI family thioesterase [Geomesophilobacter sediminis]MBJ6723226.1 PaaI family thioesterase [Geomesophilobacter sediminis]